MLKMFSPVLPHITEEIYMDYFAEKETSKSIHTSQYLSLGEDINYNVIKNGNVVVNIISQVRQFKSENKASLKAEIEEITVTSNLTEFLKLAETDILATCSIRKIYYATGEFDLKIGNIIKEEE